MRRYLQRRRKPGSSPRSLLPEEVRQRIRAAMAEGAVIDLEYEMGDDPRNVAVVTLNGAALAFASVVEIRDVDRPPVLESTIS